MQAKKSSPKISVANILAYIFVKNKGSQILSFISINRLFHLANQNLKFEIVNFHTKRHYMVDIFPQWVELWQIIYSCAFWCGNSQFQIKVCNLSIHHLIQELLFILQLFTEIIAKIVNSDNYSNRIPRTPTV